jgi:hypothetical protein
MQCVSKVTGQSYKSSNYSFFLQSFPTMSTTMMNKEWTTFSGRILSNDSPTTLSWNYQLLPTLNTDMKLLQIYWNTHTNLQTKPKCQMWSHCHILHCRILQNKLLGFTAWTQLLTEWISTHQKTTARTAETFKGKHKHQYHTSQLSTIFMVKLESYEQLTKKG